MSGQQGNDATGPGGRKRDIQARQAEDGSFELVVDDGAQSDSSDASSSAAESASDGSSAQSRASSQVAGASGAKGGLGRVGLIVIAILAAAGLAIFAFSGGDEDGASEGEQTREEMGFSPYKDGPDEAPAAAADEPAPDDERGDEAEQFEADQAAEFAEDDEAVEEEGWELEEGQDVIVVDEGYEDEDDEDDETLEEPADEVDEDDGQEARRPQINGGRLPEKIRKPIDPQRIQPIPAQQLEQLRPRLQQPQQPSPGAGGDQYDDEYRDEEGYYEDELPPEDQYDDEYYPEDQDPEYAPEEEGLDEYDDGY